MVFLPGIEVDPTASARSARGTSAGGALAAAAAPKRGGITTTSTSQEVSLWLTTHFHDIALYFDLNTGDDLLSLHDSDVKESVPESKKSRAYAMFLALHPDGGCWMDYEKTPKPLRCSRMPAWLEDTVVKTSTARAVKARLKHEAEARQEQEEADAEMAEELDVEEQLPEAD